MLTSVNGLPVNGFDFAHWSKGLKDVPWPSWAQYVGIKATHVGGPRMVNGVDPYFKTSRDYVQGRARWVGLYCFTIPSAEASIVDQMALFCSTVGRLHVGVHWGEFIFLDWEARDNPPRPAASLADIRAMLGILTRVYPGRVAVYLNDNTADERGFINEQKDLFGGDDIPIIFPQWNAAGMAQAENHNATIWQCVGEGVNTLTNGPTSFDFVMRPDRLDELCGL